MFTELMSLWQRRYQMAARGRAAQREMVCTAAAAERPNGASSEGSTKPPIQGRMVRQSVVGGERAGPEAGRSQLCHLLAHNGTSHISFIPSITKKNKAIITGGKK